jgi:cysteinyl-tRNA synthetase
MPVLQVYDTLSRSLREFAPLEPGRVRIYTCGPTVYRYAHIGNLRSYLMADWLRRFLEAQGYTVTHVKNITDVGHMRQELLDRGDDKVIASARAEGKSPEDIAHHYTEAFLRDEQALNILPATSFPRATDNVPAMVSLARRLLDAGYAYESGGNVYFGVSRFPAYGKLSGQRGEALESAGRAVPDPHKRDQRDFALWKAAEPGRELKWPSPWGDGFPGWHIECSAISAAHLGERIDYHTGGVDNIFPHHEDEIAQSEAAFGHPHVQAWMHGQHLLVDGIKMAKSAGNLYLLGDLERRGFDPLAFRYLCASVGHRSRLNFTLAALGAAQAGLDRLRTAVHGPERHVTRKAAADGETLRHEFWGAAARGLNVAAALAVAWRVARSPLPGGLKRELLLDFDRLLGLDLGRPLPSVVTSQEVTRLAAERNELRRKREYQEADAIRARIRHAGYDVRDGRSTSVAVPVPRWRREQSSRISSSGDVRSLLGDTPQVEFTVSITARRGPQELRRCIESVQRHLGGRDAEIIFVDNGFDEPCRPRVDSSRVPHGLRTFHADHFLGTAAAKNVTLKQARGRYVVFIDTSIELAGDALSGLRALLDDETVGVVGRWGVITDDLREFREASTSGDVHAVEGYLVAFRREVLQEAGLLDEKYRFYRHLDLDFSFAVRSLGYRAVIDTSLPVKKHEHVEWSATPPEERDRLSKRNFYRFLHKWGGRTDLIAPAR